VLVVILSDHIIMMAGLMMLAWDRLICRNAGYCCYANSVLMA
jgi:hypothetical protein